MYTYMYICFRILKIVSGIVENLRIGISGFNLDEIAIFENVT